MYTPNLSPQFYEFSLIKKTQTFWESNKTIGLMSFWFGDPFVCRTADDSDQVTLGASKCNLLIFYYQDLVDMLTRQWKHNRKK